MTARPYVIVFSHCYHGSVDESFVTLDAGARPRSRAGNVGPAVDPTTTTRVCEFNDLEAVERLLADEQVACVLTEPALTTIGIVLPEPGFDDGMIAPAERFVAGVRRVLAEHDVPWSIVPLGARAELSFAPEPPRTGGASAALHDGPLEDALHLFLLNRGVLITPFHNMALMCPATTAADVDRHIEVFAEAVSALRPPGRGAARARSARTGRGPRRGPGRR